MWSFCCDRGRGAMSRERHDQILHRGSGSGQRGYGSAWDQVGTA